MNPTRLAEIRATQARAERAVGEALEDAKDDAWFSDYADDVNAAEAELVRAVPELLAEIDALRGALKPFAEDYEAYVADCRDEAFDGSFRDWFERYRDFDMLSDSAEFAAELLKGGE